MSAQVGVSAQGAVCPGEVSVQGVSAQGGNLPDPSPVDRMTDRCKTLPCRNYVAEGNKRQTSKKIVAQLLPFFYTAFVLFFFISLGIKEHFTKLF